MPINTRVGTYGTSGAMALAALLRSAPARCTAGTEDEGRQQGQERRVDCEKYVSKEVLTSIAGAHLQKDLYAHRHDARHLRARFQLPGAGTGLESRV